MKIFLRAAALVVAVSWMPIANADTTVCQTTEQVGCIEFDVLNLKWDSANKKMAGLHKPWTTHEERLRRVTKLGPTFYKEWKQGKTEAAKSRSFHIFMWNVNREVVDSQLAAYVLLDKSGSVDRVDVRRSWAEAPFFDPAFDLGHPDRVYRIRADGAGAALQVPWGMVTDTTYILICADDDLGVYPNRRTANEGLWYTPEYLSWMRKKGWEYSLSPFLSLR